MFDFEVKCPFKDLHLQQEPAILELRATDREGEINALESRWFLGVFMEFFRQKHMRICNNIGFFLHFYD